MDAKAERLEEMNGQINMWKMTYAGLDDFEKADYKVQNHYKKFVKAHYHSREETEVETTQKKEQYIKGLSTALADVFKHLLQHAVAKRDDAEAKAALQVGGALSSTKKEIQDPNKHPQAEPHAPHPGHADCEKQKKYGIHGDILSKCAPELRPGQAGWSDEVALAREH